MPLRSDRIQHLPTTLPCPSQNLGSRHRRPYTTRRPLPGLRVYHDYSDKRVQSHENDGSLEERIVIPHQQKPSVVRCWMSFLDCLMGLITTTTSDSNPSGGMEDHDLRDGRYIRLQELLTSTILVGIIGQELELSILFGHHSCISIQR